MIAGKWFGSANLRNIILTVDAVVNESFEAVGDFLLSNMVAIHILVVDLYLIIIDISEIKGGLTLNF